MAKRKRRNFSKEFKAETVRLVEQGERTIPEVARDLELSETSVRSWVRQARVDSGKGSPDELTSSEREELTRLRREVRVLQAERDILKKATAFFAKESR